MINNDILVHYSQILFVLISLTIIIIITWYNITENTFPTLFFALMTGLLCLSIWSMLSPNFSLYYILFYLLLVLFYLTIQYANIKQRNLTNHEIKYHDKSDIIALTQEQERSRIYANLHDDVGAKLLELIYSAKDEKTKTAAKNILANIRHAIAQTENFQCNMIQLSESIISEAQIRLNSTTLKFINKINLIDNQQKLSLIIPNVILRITREVITNIIKHAQATEINIIITSHSSTLSIEIHDNGKGFITNKSPGKGLKTIKKRAQSINAETQLYSEINKGTRFKLNYKYDN